MATPSLASIDQPEPARRLPGILRNSTQEDASAVSWGVIVAGAAAAAALSLILLRLGTGPGLSTASPWAHNAMSATGFGVSTILWVSLTQVEQFQKP